MITEKQIQKGKEVLLKYTLPDALKPEYDGMSAYELAKKILEAAEIENNKVLSVATEETPDKYQHLSLEDDIFSHEDEEKSEREEEKEYEEEERSAHLHRV